MQLYTKALLCSPYHLFCLKHGKPLFSNYFCIGEFAGVKSLGDFGTDEIKY